MRCLAWMMVVACRIYHLYRPTWKLWTLNTMCRVSPLTRWTHQSDSIYLWWFGCSRCLLLTTNINRQFPKASGNMFNTIKLDESVRPLGRVLFRTASFSLCKSKLNRQSVYIFSILHTLFTYLASLSLWNGKFLPILANFTDCGKFFHIPCHNVGVE